MNFLEAADIAKRNPGSLVSRSEAGLFVVRLADGRVVTSPHIDTELVRQTPRSNADLEAQIGSHTRELDAAHAEIRQLRLEVNNLKSAMARIPASEWARFEEEQRKLNEQRRATEATRLVDLARGGKLRYDQLVAVCDNATTLGISGADLAFLQEEIVRRRAAGVAPSPTIVYSTTDGQ